MSELSHVDREGRARMVDVSAKADTTRVAVAAGELRTTPEVVRLVRADDMPKADVLSTARIAGINGAKKTSELIPLCHQLALSSVDVRFDFTDAAITIEASAKTKGPTGVEMEALTAVAVAGLTLHDMVKAVDPAATLNDVRLLTKDGGKHGHWERPADTPADTGTERTTADASAHPRGAGHRHVPAESPTHPNDTGTPRPPHAGEPPRDTGGHAHPTAQRPSGDSADRPGPDAFGAGRAAAVLVASTGAAAGTRTDTTGPRLVEWLAGLGFSVRGPLVYADTDIAYGLSDALSEEPALVISTGGTGASPTDATPEATLQVLDRELPGVAEAIRQRGTAKFPLASLSRGVAGLAGRTVIVNLPGSPGGVKDGIAVLEPLLEHLLAQVAGGGSHE
ncbi:bifunctional molybdenum cofactor biosynthesis protein MoaC/MoaB [Nocardia otitidiscaviarum]|uniref:Cyclic pyranopterin monophosphate synthase n=1 Tax=Nocardia otitidiscaviarum TaxID=1823 RepID=A0A516NQ65_9NOCA|nr:bifunctional molybdenum cofactor biosynthesis protein MoaC/MoaB [Nocardia otitidiscaviarum]MCP9623646.1 bifunctional molybdenum cofactor biosynthesis protein MoaC/MoaB [Nocardia otitidiscaviarum]QDP81045.1 bifunctional molybdenum cofactor biosynthesis protein MoaC/MoaB [Nocardia otitidiscaviarum]